MGIQGLIQFLEKASSAISLKDIRGHTVTIDTYCWLHKGAFACADKLSRGEDTDVHIQYCLKYVTMLLSYDIKPILVFDGKHLPAKALTEKRRKESRDLSKKRAAELLRLGRIDEARSHMRRCVDITHEMALRLIQECRKRNVDCIVAPYEADAQLAYLNKQNLAHYVITEDSDLVLFGCSKVIFKLDLNGQGLLVDAEKLHLTMGCHPERYTFEKFRNMCILSGCDYLDSLPGIGLAKACKFIKRTEETDMRRALTKIPSYLNMKNLIVTEEYIEGFLKADATFQYMFVFDPIKRTMVRLNNLPEDFDVSLCSNAGSLCDKRTAMQLALGNLNPFTLKKLDDWSPDSQVKEPGVLSLNWENRGKAKHKSIWHPNFSAHAPGASNGKYEDRKCAIEFKKCNLKQIDVDSFECEEPAQTESEILSLYSTNLEPPIKRQCLESNDEASPTSSPTCSTNSRNPFMKTTPGGLLSPTKLSKSTKSFLKNISPRKSNNENTQKLSGFSRTVINPKQKVISKFFNTNKSIIKKTEPSDNIPETTPEKKLNVNEIVNETKEPEEQQQLQDAAALYLSSPEATLSDRGDRTPPRRNSVCTAIDKPPLASLDSGIEMSTDEMIIPKELLEKYECKITSVLTDEVKENEVIELSDEEKILNVKIAPKRQKAVIRRVGLSKPKRHKVEPCQSRLSMFGFQKRPAL